MTEKSMQTAGVFLPLLKPARYKGAWGGRGSGKSHFFAGLIIEDCLAEPKGEGLRVVCIRETLRDLKESAKLGLEQALLVLPHDGNAHHGPIDTAPPGRRL
jgi:phage terminase large subunit